jgi:hypothetical protein
MPGLSVLFIRAALVYLGVGFSFGALLLFNKGLPIAASIWQLLPAHIEFLLIGWTVQLAMGVAFWITPRFTHGPKRGNEPLAWAAFGLINLGVLLSAFGPLLPASNQVALVGRACEALAALAFALHAWRRVKPFGK